MDDNIEQTDEYRVVLGVAEALRGEFGDGIDAHPGGTGTKAGVVNLAFRTTVRFILGGLVAHDDDLDDVVRRGLRWVALRRLVADGMGAERAKALVGEEPGLGDAWSAYLALAPESVIEDLLGDRT